MYYPKHNTTFSLDKGGYGGAGGVCVVFEECSFFNLLLDIPQILSTIFFYFFILILILI